MILPKEMCEQIRYYTTDTFNRNSIMYDRVTVHFKQWWKRRKVFNMRRIELEDREDWFKRSPDCIELVNLLDQIVRQSWSEDEEDKVTGQDGNVVSVNFNKGED